MKPRAAPGPAGRVLLIAPHGSYRTGPFCQAAHELGVEVLIASQGQYSIVSDYAQGIHIDLSDFDHSLDVILHALTERPINGVLGTDDITTELAARVAGQLNLPHNPVEAVRIARRKDLARDCLDQHGVRKPAHVRLDRRLSLDTQTCSLVFPVVVKPVALSASRGVIRADDFSQLETAILRIGAILDAEKHLSEEESNTLLVEAFVAGDELAVEGMLYAGELQILAIFDKPDPLDGPFFEETYYLTPSSQPATTRQAIHEVLQQACQAYGLREGPVHAECRVNEQGVWVLEVAARTIGGLCGRLLQLGTGYSLEQLVLLHALGRQAELPAQQQAVGVLMLPVPGAGILKRIEGLSAAHKVPFIEEVNIQIREGYELVPLPEGSSYPGFIFARAPSANEVEKALRDAHACLRFVLAPVWKAQIPGSVVV